MIRRFLIALVLGAGPAAAADVALLVGNASYRNARDIAAGTAVLDAEDALRAAGFEVVAAENADAAALRRAAAELAAAADGSGRIVIALSGHFAQSSAGAWVLGTDAERTDLISAGVQGLPLAVIYEIAARAPGRAVVLLGTEARRIDLGPGLSPGTGALAVPQGVAVIRGEAEAIAGFLGGAMLVPGRSLAGALDAFPALAAEGFVTEAFAFLDAPGAAPPPGPAPGGAEVTAERAAFALARSANTTEAWAEFLRIWPQGANAPAARAALEQLRADPARIAREGEEALALSRDQRREIQRDLSLLEYNTRGIDGIFGPASRSAIAAWQRANGYEATTFLTREQITRLDAQAARRAAELEAEAAARQAEQERQDRAYWQETGARGDEAGLRAYLRRYPDGLFAEVAQERLRPFDEAAQAAAAAADRAAWDRARRADTVAAYREYLAAQPQGGFRTAAEDRIAALTSDSQNAAAMREEEALNLNPFTRNLIEARLEALGLRPGRVDGVFDTDTRRAIRRYQTARDLPATGYLTQTTVVRLLADSVGVRLE